MCALECLDTCAGNFSDDQSKNDIKSWQSELHPTIHRFATHAARSNCDGTSARSSLPRGRASCRISAAWENNSAARFAVEIAFVRSGISATSNDCRSNFAGLLWCSQGATSCEATKSSTQSMESHHTLDSRLKDYFITSDMRCSRSNASFDRPTIRSACASITPERYQLL